MISMKRPRRFTRIVSVCLALFCVVAYTKIFKTQKTAEKVEIITNGPDIALEPLTTFHSRHLLDSGGDNCTKPRNHHEGYNDSCSFVLAVCGDKASLINYLAFTLCDLEYVQVGEISYNLLCLNNLLIVCTQINLFDENVCVLSLYYAAFSLYPDGFLGTTSNFPSRDHSKICSH